VADQHGGGKTQLQGATARHQQSGHRERQDRAIESTLAGAPSTLVRYPCRLACAQPYSAIPDLPARCRASAVRALHIVLQRTRRTPVLILPSSPPLPSRLTSRPALPDLECLRRSTTFEDRTQAELYAPRALRDSPCDSPRFMQRDDPSANSSKQRRVQPDASRKALRFGSTNPACNYGQPSTPNTHLLPL
jgi:hypothetical protein